MILYGSSRKHIFRNVEIARRFEYKTGEFIMHAKRENKQGENGTAGICRTIILGSYCFLLCEEAR